jgi:hypothetical protein
MQPKQEEYKPTNNGPSSHTKQAEVKPQAPIIKKDLRG